MPIDRSCRTRTLASLLVIVSSVALSAPSTTNAQTQPAPVNKVIARDHPDDIGNQLIVEWSHTPDSSADRSAADVTGYEILRRSDKDREFTRIDEATALDRSYVDTTVEKGTPYQYQVVVLADDSRSLPVATDDSVVPVLQWFHGGRAWLAVIILIVCSSVVGFIAWAKSGRDLYVRKIPGLEAVDEAVGRATEMGRPCLFVPGIQDINDIQTVAGITVLSHVSTLTAEYGAGIEVPTARSLVMTTARETVSASYLAAGRPDEYREDDIYYLTDEQFGYVASVTATMMEEKPAACFYMGAFFAESLILAETGNAVGAIQVAGTAQPSQLPFFVAACDYTLIGEEFFAASAYLSGEPVQLGSLRGQDIGKVIAGVLIIAGCGLATWAAINQGSGPVSHVLAYVTDHILGNKGILP